MIPAPGYLRLVERWGSDERIVEAARMSTGGGFRGWPDDEKLLRYLWTHKHASPFEMAGFVVEVKAPIFVLREWMRHRTQSFNELSARYVPVPEEHYVPSVERLLEVNAHTANRQAQGTGATLSREAAEAWRTRLLELYGEAQAVYEDGLSAGVSKELARLAMPVARYSVMRASANLRNWLAFIELRSDDAAQWEIRQYANVLREIVRAEFPQVAEVVYAGR